MAVDPDKPFNREEMYLAKAAGEGTTVPDEPWSRKEAYLDKISGRMDGMENQIAALATDLSFKGSVESEADLPTGAAVGDTYITEDTGVMYVWTGDSWVALGGTGINVVQTTGTSTADVMSQDATTKFVDGLIIKNAGAPTTSTVGAVGMLLEDTTNGKLYQCTAVSGSTYTWAEVGGGGGGPTVVQTTGTSTTDVMSQDATTAMVYADPGSRERVQIGNNASSGTRGVAVGRLAYSSGAGAISIGGGSSSSSRVQANGDYSLAMLDRAKALQQNSLAIGYGASSSHAGSIAFGSGSSTSAKGELNIGTTNTSYGYNSTNYRIISGVHDGQNLHDAATLAQGNTLATSAPTTSTVGVLGQLYTDTTNMHTYQCTAISGDTYTWIQRW